MTSGILPNVDFTSQNRVGNSAISARFRTGRLRNNQIKNQRRVVTKNAVAKFKDVRQLGCVFQDTELPESVSNLRKGSKVLGSVRRVRFTKATQRHEDIRENKGPSFGKIQVKFPHQRSPYAMKFEDRSQEEIERQERCARGDAWRLAKNILMLKETDKGSFFSPTNELSLPAHPQQLEEREFVVDSGASMHMLSRKDLNSAELETVSVSKSPTTVVKANGEVLTKEEATVYVRELDSFVTVTLLEETPAVLSLGKLCEQFRYSYHWMSGQKPHLIKKDKKIHCDTSNHVTFVVPGLSTSSSTLSTSPTSSSQETVIDTEIPSTRSESTSEESLAQEDPLQRSAEFENPKKNDDKEEVRGNLSHDLTEWLHEFRHGLVDESVPEHRDAYSSSQELPLKPRAKWYRAITTFLLIATSV